MDNEAAALARKRWAKAKRTTKTCPLCGGRYRGVKEQIYCTPAHQQAAATRRTREKRRAGAPAPPAPPRPAVPPSPLDASLERQHALAEAAWARREGNLAEAARWEAIAARIAAGIAASVE